ncbi:hypothetical protein [Polyangium aurulentum]|uniref:hypothetical protein n=1 Tax=Polyangium aurulentum TaxID=2567896 RepID=UPI0010AE43DF|nr:hypothetical protein [Polyangium aurulentum]UQA55890.1 hypothetical protein E8A73_031770 [Polyangium aurulentum]
MARSAFFLGIGFFIFMMPACGGGAAEQPIESAATPPAPTDAPAPAKPDGALGRLQGTWEIVRYQSDTAIPGSAMPLMAELFDSLRLRFEPDHALVSTSKTTDERMEVAVEDGGGGGFKLRTKGSMFDGAACRFLGPDEWEVTDSGRVWPGVSVIRRVKP